MATTKGSSTYSGHVTENDENVGAARLGVVLQYLPGALVLQNGLANEVVAQEDCDPVRNRGTLIRNGHKVLKHSICNKYNKRWLLCDE